MATDAWGPCEHVRERVPRDVSPGTICALPGSRGRRNTLPWYSDQWYSDHMSRLHKQYMSVLTGEIVNGVYLPGSFLPSEVELVEQLQISRGVVRECLRGLEERGLVSVRHGKGAQVLAEEEWDFFDGVVLAALAELRHRAGMLSEYLECRKMLEVEGAGLAAVRATPKQMNDLRAAFALLVARTRDMATSSHSEAQYHAADIGFHRTLAGASGIAHSLAWSTKFIALPCRARYSHGRTDAGSSSWVNTSGFCERLKPVTRTKLAPRCQHT